MRKIEDYIIGHAAELMAVGFLAGMAGGVVVTIIMRIGG